MATATVVQPWWLLPRGGGPLRYNHVGFSYCGVAIATIGLAVCCLGHAVSNVMANTTRALHAVAKPMQLCASAQVAVL